LARTEAELARKETSLARELAASQAEKMWQRRLELAQDIRGCGAGVLPWVEVLSPGSPFEAGPSSAEGGNNAEGAAAPPADA
jgi:hypothetical protein